MKRNLLWILIAVSLCAWLKPPPLRVRYEPNGPPLTVDGVGLEEDTRAIDARLGPGSGEMTRSYSQGTVVECWFNPQTGVYRSTALTGGCLRQGDVVLAGLDQSRAEVERRLGPATPNTWKDAPSILEIPPELKDAPGRAFYLNGNVRVEYVGDRVARIGYSRWSRAFSRL